MELLPLVVSGRRYVGGLPSDEGGERGGSGTISSGGLFQRLEEAQPLTSWFGGEHAAGATDHGRYVSGMKGVAYDRSLVMCPHEHGNIAGPDRASFDLSSVDAAIHDRRIRGEQTRHVGSEVRCHEGPPGLRLHEPPRRVRDRPVSP